MPKISDIQETPNPNAVKFILREPVTSGVARQFGSNDQARSDELARSLFEVGSVASVFYMDNMITVEKEDAADWDVGIRGQVGPGRRTRGVGGHVRARLSRVLLGLPTRTQRPRRRAHPEADRGSGGGEVDPRG